MLSLVFGTSVLAKDLPGNVRLDSEAYQESYLPAPQDLEEIYAPQGGKPVGEAMEKIKLYLLEIELQGGTTYPQEALQLFYQDLLNKEIVLADIYRVTEQITRKYRKDGYLLSRAIIPEQRIKEGKVQIQIVEGIISNVIIKTPKGMESLKAQIDVEKIKGAKPFSISVLERSLLLLRDMPGVGIQSLLRPAKQEGSAELVIELTLDKVNGRLLLDNYGSRFMGPVRTMLDLNLNSPIGYGEHFGTTLTFVGNNLRNRKAERELSSYRLHGDWPMGSDGVRGKISYLYTKADPGHTLAELEVKAVNRYWELGLSYPVIRSRTHNLKIDGGYRHKSLVTTMLQQDFTDDQIRSLYASVDYDFADIFGGLNLFSITLTEGLNHDNATQLGSLLATRAEARPDYRKWSGKMMRDQKLDTYLSGLSLVLSAAWQYTSDPLFSSEEFTVGGRLFGRGFDLGEIAGDRGAAVAVELNYNGHNNGIEHDLYAFIDGGTIRNIDQEDEGADRESDTLTSAGMGLKLRGKSGWLANLELSKPLNRKPATEEDQSPRLRAQVGYQF